MSPATRNTTDPVRRIAWVSYGLALACVAGFFFAKSATLEADAAMAGHLVSAEEFFREHPYLEPPPILERQIPRQQIELMKQNFQEARQRRSAPPIPARIQLREQANLEQMVTSVVVKADGLPTRRWGVRPSEHQGATFFTHILFHAGWLHLLGNLLLLVLLGYFLEGVWGSAIFGCVAVAVAVGAAGVFVLQNPEFDEPLIGISGLVAGLLGAFLVRFGGTREPVPYGVPIILGSLILLLPVWFGLEWSIARGVSAPPAQIGAWGSSAWALAGGFMSGALVSFGIRVLGVEGSIERAEVAGEIRRGAANPKLERALQERSAGHLDEAFNLLQAILRREPEHLDASLAFWDVANDLGRPGAAVNAILRVIRDQIRRGDFDNAVKHWLELVECGLDGDAEPALLIRMATLLRDVGYREAAVRALRNALLRAEGKSSTTMASRVAREASELDPPTAAKAAWRALGSVELDLRERQNLENLLAEIHPSLGLEDDEPSQGTTCEPQAAFSAADLSEPEPDVIEPEPSAPEPSPDPIEESGAAETRPDPIELEEGVRQLQAIMAVPTGFDSEGLLVEMEGGAEKRVRFDLIEAVSVAAVDGLSQKTVIVLDLVLNWISLTAESLTVIRLRGDRFDPRRVAPGCAEPLDALRAIIQRILDESEAIPLPDLQSACGMPFAAFPSLADYHRDVLMVDEDRLDPYSWVDET
jgi:membrane associated rhomboid family serine protease/tetratricopeptide (TPR) repeat protein